KRLKQQDYFLLAISGSHHELVEGVAKHYGFDDYQGSKYERDEDKYSGKSFIASFHKKQLLKDMIDKHDLSLGGSYAVGDSNSDAPMLELVENPIAFNPNDVLLAMAKQKGWKIIIERKNVVY